VRELKAQAALVKSSTIKKAERRDAVTKIKEQQRALASGVKGLTTAMGKPPRTTVKLYRKLKFKKELTAVEARDTVDMLILPETHWGEEAFKAADSSGNGEIDLEELKSALVALGLADVSSEEAARIFQDVDVDNSGYLTYEEFREVASKIAEKEEGRAAEQHRHGVDENGDGSIDLQEMWDALEALGIEMSEAQVEMLWQKCDADGSGELDITEFGKAVDMARLIIDNTADGDLLTVEDCRDRLESLARFQTLTSQQRDAVIAVAEQNIAASAGADPDTADTITASELDLIVEEVLKGDDEAPTSQEGLASPKGSK